MCRVSRKWLPNLTINCKNSPSSVGGEMNCNKIKKEHLFWAGECVIIYSVENRKKAIYNEIG